MECSWYEYECNANKTTSQHDVQMILSGIEKMKDMNRMRKKIKIKNLNKFTILGWALSIIIRLFVTHFSFSFMPTWPNNMFISSVHSIRNKDHYVYNTHFHNVIIAFWIRMFALVRFFSLLSRLVFVGWYRFSLSLCVSSLLLYTSYTIVLYFGWD